tara:strand:+ start:404 stop:1903 length:1500 start_codon:yes stop_codon:yes gene_type:complete
MAIGDTVQAGLMKIDTSAYERAGQANANANMAFGNALNQVAKGFIEGREKKARAEEMTGYLMNQGVAEKDAKAIAKNPFLQKEYQRKKGAEQQMKIEEGRIAQMAANRRSAQKIAGDKAAQIQSERDLIRADADELKQAKGDFLGKFYSSVPTGEMNEAGQEELANFEAFAAPEDPRTNPFIQETLQNPEFQQTEPVMDMTGNRFAQQFAGDSPEVQQLALNFMQARQKDAPSISRVVNMEDGQGGFQQVGVDSTGNPIRSFGPPKPSGMFATPDQQADARAKTLSVDNANDFVNTQRNSALDSAKSIRPATRALTLLEKGDLETGGVAELKTNAIAMLDSLGIPIDKETMDKVSNTQNFRAEVGKFLFENISNTKGSISEKEMDIFAKISPGLQMTPEANKTLLNYVIKKAERDKEKVKFIQKMRRDGVSITEQRNKLEDYMLENDLSEILSPIAGETSEQQPFRSPQGNVNGKVVGTKPNGDKLIEVNGKIFVQPAQ